jgi:NhaP-type Na+/H+ or K+/H+ antiporter
VLDLELAFALVAVVLVATALLSGVIERSPLSFPLIFLGLGIALSDRGVGLLTLGPHDPALEAVATLTLALVLFLDAARQDREHSRERWIVPALILGPGTGLIIAIGAVPLALLLGFSWPVAFIGGAVLASTDPVVLREVLRDEGIPRSIRDVLKVEAGMNDLVVLPVILVLIAVARADAGIETPDWPVFLAQLLFLGPVIGFAIGGAGAWAMARLDARMSIRSEQQALFGIGLVLASYSTVTALGGDGFLGAFFAGFAVSQLNQRLCDCFLDFGEIVAEMAMVLAFVLFGVTLSPLLDDVDLLPTLALAIFLVLLLRPAVINLVLVRAHISWEARALVAWFGPRGLNSLLLALLAVQAGLPEAERLLVAVGFVVLVSVVLHGASAGPLVGWYDQRARRDTLEEERESTAAGLLHDHPDGSRLIAPDELARLLESAETAGGVPPLILDVRSRSTFERDGSSIPGSVRVLPDRVREWARDVDPRLRDRLMVAYCT